MGINEIGAIGNGGLPYRIMTVNGSDGFQGARTSLYDEIKDSNYSMKCSTHDYTLKKLSELKKNGLIELHDEWYHIFSDDYIKISGDGKMTYGQIREMLGVPPGAISNFNNISVKDSDIIQDSFKLRLYDIGYFERRMDEGEAMYVRHCRNYGDKSAGYERSVTNKEICEIFRK